MVANGWSCAMVGNTPRTHMVNWANDVTEYNDILMVLMSFSQTTLKVCSQSIINIFRNVTRYRPKQTP